MSQWAKYSTPDPELAPLLAKFPKFGFDNPIAVRERFDKMLPGVLNATKHELPAETEYRLEDRKVLVDGGEITARCLTPTAPDGETFPILVWYHGGGWLMGRIEMDDYTLRRWCVALKVVIVNVDYRLAPEYPYPTGPNDCYAALKWTAENIASSSGDIKKGFLVGGFSAGGTAAALMALKARDDPFFQGRPVTGQFLNVPQVVHPDAIPEKYKDLFHSMEQNKDSPILDRAGLLKTNELVGARPDDANLWPLLATTQEGLPPAFLQIGGIDPLRDDGLVYEQALREAGVKTKFEVYTGMPHGGRAMFPNVAIYKQWDKDQVDGLGWLLSGAVA